MSLFIPISKVDVAQRLVYGVLTEEIADKSGEILDYATAKPAFETWSNQFSEATAGKSLGNVRAMHGSIAAGKFTDISYDDDAKRIEGCAKIIDEGEWQKVLEGVYTGFSIGGGYAKRWQDPSNPKLKRYTPTLTEVSIVDNPCVPTATFEVIKADGSVEMRKFTHSNHEDSMDPKALADAKDALAKGTATDEQKALIETEAAELLKAAQDADTAGTATDEQKELLTKAVTEEPKPADDAAKPALVKDGKALKPKSAPLQKWLADDGQAFDSKREAEVHNIELEKKAELTPGVAQMDALLKAATAPKTEDAPAADEPAKAGAADVAKAADAATEPLKKDGVKLDLKKGLWQIGELACLLSQLQNLQDSVEFEQIWEQDTSSELPTKFKGLVAEMCQVLVALVDEETRELIASGDDVDVEVLAMAVGLPKNHAEALGKVFTGNEKLVKSAEALVKAGARHSKADTEALMDLHKSATDHVDSIEKCFKGMGIMDDGVDKAAQKMSKVLSELSAAKDEVKAVSKVAVNSNETLMKALPVMESLIAQNAELAKRVGHLEDQPMPAKGATKVISKAQDNGGTGDGNAKAEYEASLEKMTPDERAQELMKLTLRNPLKRI